MLFVNCIRDIVRLGIASAYVKNDEPVSIILLGNPESGKSSILLSFVMPKEVCVLTDATKTKLENYLLKISNFRYLVIPDFIKVVSRNRSTRANLISFLNAGIEEGIHDVTEYFGGSIQKTTEFKDPLRFGLATSMTRSSIEDRRKEWYRIGFFSRLLPVSFSYTKEQQKKIREYIHAGKDLYEEKEKLRLKTRNIKCNKKFSMHFEPFIEKYADANKLYGFRITHQFRCLLKASALLRGSSHVTKKDVDVVSRSLKWINLDYNQVNNNEKK